MGYRAIGLETPTIVIKTKDAEDIIRAIQSVEETHGHISWCGLADEYLKNNGHDYVQAFSVMMEHFGFLVEEDEDRNIHLIGWGGDKIGSSWEFVWGVLGKFSTNEIVWVMQGEDYEHWAERIGGGSHKTCAVKVDFTVLN